MFGTRFGFLAAAFLALVAASMVRGQDDVAGEIGSEADVSPRLVLKTDEAFVHFAPWVSPREARWDWTPYGELYLTRRDDGTMTRLLSSGVEGLPTRRMKYVETRIAAVGVAKDQVVAVVWRAVSWDRPLLPRMKEESTKRSAAADEALSLTRSVHIFSALEGKPIRVHTLTEAEVERLKVSLELLPTDTSAPRTLTEEQAEKLLSLAQETPATP